MLIVDLQSGNPTINTSPFPVIAEQDYDLSSESSTELGEPIISAQTRTEGDTVRSDKSPVNSTVSSLMSKATVRRRASVAVWSDPKLSSYASSHMNKASIASLSRFSLQNTPPRPAIVPTKQRLPAIQRLEEDVICLIFSYLDFRDFWRVKAACKQWYLAAQSSSCVHIQYVCLQPYHKKITDLELERITNFCGPNLTDLDLHSCWQLSDRSLSQIARVCYNLEVLICHGCWEFTSTGVSMIARACPGLKKIDFSNCRKLDDQSVISLISVNEIEDLTFSYCKNLSNATMQALCRSAGLKRLNMQRCTGITDAGFLIQSPACLSQLNTLVLSDCSFLTDTALVNIGIMAPNLVALNLSFCCAITSSGLQSIAEHCRSLRYLDVSYCGTAASNEMIILLSQKLKELSHFSVRGCGQVSDAGIMTFENANAMKALNLSGCRGVSNEMLIRLRNAGIRLMGAQEFITDFEFDSNARSESMNSSHIRRHTSPG